MIRFADKNLLLLFIQITVTAFYRQKNKNEDIKI